MSYQWTSAILGFFIAGMIFYLIRRDHLHTHHAPWWLLVALSVAVLGVFPRLIDWIAAYLHINYAPSLAFLLGLGLLLIKVLTIDIHQSRQERQIRRMAQRLALLEDELRANRERDAQNGA